MAPSATETYEVLRSQALFGGGSRAGLAAIVHHGLIVGLTKVMASPSLMTTQRSRHSVSEVATRPSISCDPALVRLLATMVLRINTEVRHVY